MSTLKDKVAIVTGASSGIGAGIVKELLESGMKVVGLARRKVKVDELGKGYEGKLFARETDLTKDEDIANAFNWTEENVGPVYVLVNNAGVGYKSLIDEGDIEMFNISGHYPAQLPGYSIYTTSKYGVTAFTESIRREVATSGSKIKVTNLSPGLVESEMAQSFLDKYIYLKSEDIARGVKYIITQPPGVNVAQLTLRPTGELL
ncbi:short chain dehydrogenase [Popillia japonica]|uniref:Short chain dehydrogenase n=1 Tax=Popillia japonica TaxID=7064 RepID=A0AAW1LUA3_POPJA